MSYSISPLDLMAPFQNHSFLTCPHLPFQAVLVYINTLSREFLFTLPQPSLWFILTMTKMFPQAANRWQTTPLLSMTWCTLMELRPVRIPPNSQLSASCYLKLRTVQMVTLNHLTRCIYFTLFSSVLLLLWHILFYPSSALSHFIMLPFVFTSLTVPTLLPNFWATSHHTQLNLLTVQLWHQRTTMHGIISQNTVMFMAQFILPYFKVKSDLRNTSLYDTSELWE
jgi:hypothetical protein